MTAEALDPPASAAGTARLPDYVTVEAPSSPTSTAPAVSVVIPAYNETGRIPAYLRTIIRYFEGRGEACEVLVVDDGSTDGTGQLVRELMRAVPCLGLVHYARNRGKGHAVRMGMLAARGGLRLMADADGSTPIEEIARLRARMPAREPAAVVGSRALGAPDVRRDIRLHRYLIGRVFATLTRVVLGLPVRDTQCGFKLFNAAAAHALFTTARVDGFAFDVEVLFLAARAGIPVVEVPVSWHDAGSSRVRFWSDPFKMARDVWRVRAMHAQTVVPPAAAGPDPGATRSWPRGRGRRPARPAASSPDAPDPPPARPERLVSAIVVASFVLVILALASPAVVGRVPVADDLGSFHLPLRSAYQAALRAHQSVLWSPQLYSGFYVHGEGQVGMFHPVHWVLYRFLPLTWAFTLEFVLSYAVMFPGTYLWLRRLELSRAPALTGALVFTFSGFNLLHFMHLNAIAVIAHLPWLLLWIDLLLRSADRRQVALAQLLISLGTGSQVLLGHPQFVWLCGLAELAFVAWRLRDVASRWRVARLAWAVGLGTLLGSVQLLPTVEALAASARSHPSPEFRSLYGLHVANLLQLVSPYSLRGRVMGENVQESALYNGALCSVALGWLLLRWRALGRWRRLVTAALGLAAVMLILALGASGGLYLLVSSLPGMGAFRAPSRYVLLVHLALALVAAVMMADLIGLAGRPERAAPVRSLWPLMLVPGLSLAALAGHAWLWHDPGRHPWSAHLWPLRYAAVGTGGILVASLLVMACVRGIRVAPGLLALFTAVDLALWGGSFVWREPPQPLARVVERLPLPPSQAGNGRIDVTGADWISEDTLVMAGYRLASGYVGLPPRRALSSGDPAAQRLLGIRWILDHGRWAEVGDPLPRARLVTDARVSRDVPGDLPATNIRETALVSEPVGALGSSPGGTARIVRDEPGLIEVSTTSPSRQLLVLSEAYHPGWTATEDGRVLEVHRAYQDLQACVVDAGTHRIVFAFRPRSVLEGWRLSASALLLVAVSFLVAIAPRRPKARG